MGVGHIVWCQREEQRGRESELLVQSQYIVASIGKEGSVTGEEKGEREKGGRELWVEVILWEYRGRDRGLCVGSQYEDGESGENREKKRRRGI